MARVILNMTIQDYTSARKRDYREIWNLLYKMFLKIYHVNLKVRARNRNMSPIAYAEKHKFINTLLGLALIIFMGY